jgi:protein ImuB
MKKRYVSIWFRHLLTDWLLRQQPELKDTPYVVTMTQRGQMIIIAANPTAEAAGIETGMVLADARALLPEIVNFDEKEGLAEKLLNVLGAWCVRYTPCVSVNLPDGLILDVTGCTHLKGGEIDFLKDLVIKLRGFGYNARAAMADTIGAAWGVARFARKSPIVSPGKMTAALAYLPPAALRLSEHTTERLKKLGILRISELYNLPRPVLTRRFGKEIVMRLDQVLGMMDEKVLWKNHVDPYREDLMTPEGVATAEGIAAALKQLLGRICHRLHEDEKGLRGLLFDCFRVDGFVETVDIGTNRPSRNARHLFKLFENKLDKIEPALGIEQFRLSASGIEPLNLTQDTMLGGGTLQDSEVKEMVDRLSNRIGPNSVNSYVPRERYWPERSVKAVSFSEVSGAETWPQNLLRPIRLLKKPEPIEVTAPVPDYPPMLFRYQNRVHRVKKADGPERIEREWWLEKGPSRDYFKLEDEDGNRYWVFRSGHYMDGEPSRWFLHGLFA